MTSIDVWIADWEIGCCRNVPGVGEAWSAVLTFEQATTPGTSSEVSLERLDDGLTSFAGPVVGRVGYMDAVDVAVVGCDGFHLFIQNAPVGDHLRGAGRLYEDNHFMYIDEAGFERWKAEGVVRRLWMVWEDGEGVT
ncbi:MAG: hypothetical protein M3159_02730 [Actinomycetota bacterium]|nr:hypothetical protein [Actinomycetota bacterium]